MRNFVHLSTAFPQTILRIVCGNYIISVRKTLIFVDLIKKAKLFVPSADLK